MYHARRSAASVVAQAVVALALASGASLLLRLAGPTALFIAVFVLLTLLFFFGLAILRGALAARALRRGHGFGGGPPRGRGPRPPYPGGAREPRRPFRPGMPPREAAAELDTTT